MKIDFLGKIIIGLILFLLFAVSLAGYLGKYSVLFDTFSHFRLQYLLLTLIGLFITFLYRDKYLIILTLLIFTLNFYEIASLYVPINIPKTSITQKVKLLTINVFVHNQHQQKVIQEIKRLNPDIVVLIEINPTWAKTLKSLEKDFPYHHLEELGMPAGIGVWSKFPSKFTNKQYLENINRPSILAQVKFKNRFLDILAIHPHAPVDAQNFARRNQMFSTIAQQNQNISQNFVVVGDLNTTSFSPYFKEFSQNLQLRDSRQGYGLQLSWKKYKSLLWLTIDHCLISHNLIVLDRQIGNDIGSDHYPVYVELGLIN